VQGKDAANEVHYQAGVVVRRAIAELGGTMPENLPTAESIKKLESAEKKRLVAPKAKSMKDEESE
jgi:DNA-damage-inducible protein D